MSYGLACFFFLVFCLTASLAYNLVSSHMTPFEASNKLADSP